MFVLAIPTEFWLIFLFALGASAGSFLNVVVYRLPKGMSLLRPGSRCVSCDKPIAWYDNVPILSWFLLRGRCRHCGSHFSVRYALVELLTALLFVGLYLAYFHEGVRDGMPAFAAGGWLIYAGHIVLVCVLLACSLIDGEHWIIPLSVSYTAAIVAVVLSMVWPYYLGGVTGDFWRLAPYATAATAAAAVGAGVGLLIGFLLLGCGVIKSSFAEEAAAEAAAAEAAAKRDGAPVGQATDDIEINIRVVMGREVAFLAPAVVLGLACTWFFTGEHAAGQGWQRLIAEQKWLAGLLGSVFGFMIGGAVVWLVRILGSLAFRREAMGLGDVHLMAAVGAMLGWPSATIAFFVAPFLGLGWALARLLVRGGREIPYGPFLSAGVVVVMIMHDKIMNYFLVAFGLAG